MRKRFATLLSAVALLAALVWPAAALDTDSTVTMTAEGDRAAITLTLPQEETQGITSLRLSFAVQIGDEAHIGFEFADGLSSGVQQARYNAATGRLTVYLSGRQPVFPEDGTLSLGEIQLSGGQNVTATVSVIGDSLQLANGAYGTRDGIELTAQPVQLAVAGTAVPPADEGTPDQPSGGETPSGPGNSDADAGDQTTSEQTPTGTGGSDQSSSGQNTAGQSTSVTSDTASETSNHLTKPDGGQSGTDSGSGQENAAATPETQDTEALTDTVVPEEENPQELLEEGTPEAETQASTSQSAGWLPLGLAAGAVIVIVIVAAVLLLRRLRR